MSSQLKSAIKLCRLCTNVVEDTEQKDLFHKSNKCILEQIKELTGLTLKDMPKQKLPRFFCADCKEELPRACDFRRKIIKTQSYFKSKEYKNKLKELKKTKSSSVTVSPLKITTSDLDDTKTVFEEENDCDRDDDNATPMDFMETLIKEETRRSFSESNDENPIDPSVTNQTALNNTEKSLNANLNTLDKASRTNKASQEFDAVFLPLKKEDNELNKISDNESDRDVLDDFTADESEDPDFEIEFNAKKKYPKKPQTQSTNNSTKTEAPKDPRKNPLFCFICSTTLKTSHAYKVHCRKLHKGEKIFKCDSCEETFLRIKSLIRHNRIHIGGKLFECRYCDMSFNAPTTRIHHERAKHTKDWPFLCPICGKSFITTTRGKEHMTVHTKERPYKCELCKTAYLQRNNFKKHRRSELHKNNEKKLKESMENVSSENATNEDKNKDESTEK